jgi:hypothetical protein
MSYIEALIIFLIILVILIVALWGPNWYYREKPRTSKFTNQNIDQKRQGRTASSLLNFLDRT